MLTTYKGDVRAFRALKAGASGLLLKSALRTAAANPAWLAEIDTVSVSSSGLSVRTAFSINLQYDPVTALFYAAARLYGFDAIVRDASRGMKLGHFAIPCDYQVITLLPDPANSRVVLSHSRRPELAPGTAVL